MKRIIFAVLLLAIPAFAHVGILAQTGGACGASAHCTVLAWTASTTTGATYNVFRGTTSGGESTIPLNAAPLTVLTYTDPVTLTSSTQTIFYCVEAVETTSGVTASSACSAAEVSVTFPGTPSSPSGVTGTPH